jgi:hypothetical protein
MIWLLYLADIINGFTLLLIILGTTGFIIALLAFLEEKFHWKYCWISVAFLVVSALLPSKDFIYKALALEVTREVVASNSFNSGIEEVSNTTKKLLAVINSKLDEQLPKDKQ